MSEATLSTTLQNAIAHHQAGRLPQAEALYREMLARDPRCADALHLLGVIALQVGRGEIAVDLIRRAVVLSPTSADFHGNLGEAYRRLSRFDEAVASLRQAVALRPSFPVALNCLGVVRAAQGQSDEAVSCYKKALQMEPDCADALHNLGNILAGRGEHDEAQACFQRVLAVRPQSAETLSSLGNTFVAQNRLDEAMAAYRRALALQPDYAAAHSNLANLLKEWGQAGEAVACFRRALALKPDYIEAHSNLILALLCHAGDNGGIIDEELRQWNQQHAISLTPSIVRHGNDRSPGRRLRIGYVSPDLREHPVGRNLLPLFQHHNHGDFEVFGYAHLLQPDSVTRQIQAGCDHWREITTLTDAQLAELIRRDEIDLLVDLALHTAKHRLLAFARKPAPVQVSFAGYPGGTGVATIDYNLTDPFLEPSDTARTSGPDAPFPLPASFWCFEGLVSDLPVGLLPAVSTGRITFGCLNHFCKVNDPTLHLWARVLRDVPGSRLLLLAPQGAIRERTLDVVKQGGVTADRIEFVDRQPRERYLAIYQRIDVCLDTFPYNGHTTSLDSYWMGVPVVTLVGPTPVSRAGWSQLSNLGLPELAAKTPDDFVRVASELACDLPRLARLRAGLRERMRRSPLMDGAQFTLGIESAYRTMWRRWCSSGQSTVGQ